MARWCMAAGLALLVSLNPSLPDPGRWPVSVIALLRVLPLGELCGGAVDTWTSLVRGHVDPRDVARCTRWIPDTRSALRIAEAMARHRELRVPARQAALSLLTQRGGPSPRAATDLLTDPETPPDLRRWALSALREAPDAEWWAFMARSVAIHGLFVDSARILGEAGEPGFAQPARRAILLEGGRAPPDSAPGFDWTIPDEPAPPQPALPVADSFVTVASGGEDTVADAIREEIHAIARWVSVGDPGRRARRLTAAVAHPDPPPGPTVPGDLHAALVRGVGSPAISAILATMLGSMTDTPVRVWASTAEGDLDALTIEIGRGLHRVPWCGGAHPAYSAPAGEPLSLLELEALALLEATHRLLHRGDWRAAADAARGAAEAWPSAPGAPTAVLFAAGFRAPSPAPLVGQTYAPRTAFLPRSGRHAERAFDDPRPAALLAARGQFRTVSALDLEPRTVAAFWLARSGRLEAAHALFPAAFPPGLSDIHAATALILDEPATPGGPVSTWIAAGPVSEPSPCTAAYRLLPSQTVIPR